MSLATQVIVGLVAGLAAGMFFGELMSFLKVFGDAFIMLLQMTVIPYVTVSLITALGQLTYAEMGVTGFIGKLAPYGVFALTASAAGTIDLDELRRLQVYVVVYVLLATVVSFWLLPALVACVTPLRYGDVVRGLRGPLFAAFATGSLLIVLPVLANDSKKLIARAAGRAE